METEGVIWLRKIQDGSISEFLTEYSELEEMKLTNLRRKVAYTITDLNKKSRFPKRKILESVTASTTSRLYGCIKYLKEYVLVIDVTIPELLNVFGIRKERVLDLPPQLDYATYYNLSGMRRCRGGTMNWDEKIENPRGPNRPYYNIALVSEDGIPVFAKAFSFLEHCKL